MSETLIERLRNPQFSSFRDIPPLLDEAASALTVAQARIEELTKINITLHAERTGVQDRLAEIERERDTAQATINSVQINHAALRKLAARLRQERDRLKALCTEGSWETVESEQAWKRRAETAEQERDALKKGILDYITGDYPHPRQYRPQNCPHGVGYWQECEQCNAEHFSKLLGS